MIKRRIDDRILSPLLAPLSSLLAPARPGNVIMFHIGRCGSTVVGRLLGKHPRVYWASELYSPILREWQRQNGGIEVPGEMPDDPIAILRRNMQLALHRFYGLEVKPFHLPLIGHSARSFLDRLDSLGFTHFILLDRKNRLRKVVSSVIAHQQGAAYHVGRGVQAPKRRVHLDPLDVRIDFAAKPLVKHLSDYDDQVSTLEELLVGRKLLRLTYEEDVQADPRRAYARICSFLGLQPRRTSVALARTNPFPIRELIGNADEVAAALAGTPYEWMLNN